MSHLLIKVMNLSLYAAILILVVILLRVLFKKAPKWISCLFWALVAVRLLCPVTIESSFSLLPSDVRMPTTIHSTIANQESEAVTAKQTSPIVNEYESTSCQSVNVIDSQSDESYNTEYVADSEYAVDSLSERNVKTHKTGYIRIITIIWLVGFGVMMFQSLFSFLRLKHTVAASVRAGGNVYICDDIQYPFVLGIVRPRIYLPTSVAGGMKNYVLAHERAHLSRHDHWWKPLGFFLLALHWFNPLCWIAYILFCRDLEMACDERVIKDMDRESKADYSETLLMLSSPVRRITACPVAFGEIGVKQRVKGIFNYKKPGVWVVLLAFAISAAVAVCFLTSPIKNDAVAAEDDSIVSQASVDMEVAGDVVYEDDIDGNGQMDYIYMYRLPEKERTDDHAIDWSLVLNGEEVDRESNALVCDFDACSIDVDSDNKDEIMVRIFPHVNSMPLEEFSVLKNIDGAWVKLQDTSDLGFKTAEGDEMSAFPVNVTVGAEPGTLDLQVSEDKTITIDVKDHYEKMLDDVEVSDLRILADNFLNKGQYAVGEEFGTIADWGTWEIEKSSIDGVTCLCASEGISSIEGGKSDIIGTLKYYFNYGEDGKINIIKTDFEKA